MASPLFFQTNHLNHHLTLPHHHLCISWKHSQKRWQYSTQNKLKLIPHLCAAILLPWSLISPEILFILASFVYQPNLYSIQEIIIHILVGSFYPLVFVFEMLLLKYGGELVAIANWGIAIAFKLDFQKSNNNDISFYKAFWNEHFKIVYNRRNVDWFAILASNYLILALLLSFLMSVFLTFENLDNSYIVLKGIASEEILNGPNLLSSAYLKSCRYLVMIYIWNCVASAYSYFILILVSCQQVGIKIMLYQNKMQVSFVQIQVYRQVQICICLISSMDGVINELFLSFAFVLLLICINLSVLGYKFLSMDIYLLVVSIVVVLFVFVMLVLYVNSFIFEITSKTLQKWRKQVHQTVRVPYFKRLLASMRPVALPVGSVGIIDKEIKVNYLYSLVNYAVDTLIACKDLI